MKEWCWPFNVVDKLKKSEGRKKAGKVQYITKQKEKKCACPGKWILYLSK